MPNNFCVLTFNARIAKLFNVSFFKVVGVISTIAYGNH